MKRALFILLSCVIQAHAASSPKTPLFGDGIFVGMEPMPGYHDPLTPKDRWFHQNTLTIKGRDATLSKSPVSYNNGRKSYSASDGGFYTYRGAVNFSGGQWQLVLLLIGSDYVARPIDKDGKPIPPKPQRFTITRMKDGSLQIGEVTYRRSKSK